MFKRLVDKGTLLWGLSPHILSAFQASIIPRWVRDGGPRPGGTLA